MKPVYRQTSMWTRILAWIFVLLFVVVFFVPVYTSCESSTSDIVEPPTTEPTISETLPTETTEPKIEYILVDLPEPPEYPSRENLVTIYDVEAAIQLCEDFLEQCSNIKLQPEIEHPQTGDLIYLIETAEEYRFTYESILAEHWYNREQTLSVMTEIWHYLSETAGFNHAVTAGIIGNMSAESGGCGYEDIEVYNWDNATGRSYYGICQWSIKYNPEIANTDLKFQLDYLVDTYDHAFTHWGYNYSHRYGSKFRTEQFVNMSDPYEAAIAFAVCYERCASRHVELRGPLANKAYEYFTVLGSWPWPGPNPADT